MKFYLAIDLKDNGGIFTIGEYSDIKLKTISFGSFINTPYSNDSGTYWDVNHIFSEIKKGIARAVRIFGEDLVSIGITAWGNDFGLLDQDGELLQDPLSHYGQDNRDIHKELHQLIPEKTLFEITACNSTHLTTLCQLLALKTKNPDLIKKAKGFLCIPDIFNYWLTGIQTCDKTMASTTQLYHPNDNTWATQLIEAINIDPDIFPPIKPPGSILGTIQESLQDELGILHNLQVVIPGCHDSACATAAIPNPGGNFAYLCSGTWHILGINIKKAITTEQAMRGGFTNESGVDPSINLLRVTRGHWALEQCQHTWKKEDGEKTSWDDISEMALNGTPFFSVIDITAPCFQQIGNMPEILKTYCKKTEQPIPETREDIARIFMEGMALHRRKTVTDLEPLADQKIYSLLVAGSGARNHTVNIFTANALRRKVVAGPFEAESTGNLIMQMIAMGDVSTVSEGKKLIKNSTISVEYNPTNEHGWDEAYEKMLALAI